MLIPVPHIFCRNIVYYNTINNIYIYNVIIHNLIYNRTSINHYTFRVSFRIYRDDENGIIIYTVYSASDTNVCSSIIVYTIYVAEYIVSIIYKYNHNV